MIDRTNYVLVIKWSDGEREAVSDHTTLQAAATSAFGLADELSVPDCARRASEVAVVHGDDLQLSIAIIPGQPLRKLV